MPKRHSVHPARYPFRETNGPWIGRLTLDEVANVLGKGGSLTALAEIGHPYAPGEVLLPNDR